MLTLVLAFAPSPTDLSLMDKYLAFEFPGTQPLAQRRVPRGSATPVYIVVSVGSGDKISSAIGPGAPTTPSTALARIFAAHRQLRLSRELRFSLTGLDLCAPLQRISFSRC
ncbi:Protein of unknown function [Cotesia congregata]|uniref:Uncharacterized protein n=1 Tax=Cotesia congregata TaxID=51543 RepID=A0A8J2HL58_COTCN|nr:Protein of unknown function [Cotesia congregata]